jgi:hypothetical protein
MTIIIILLIVLAPVYFLLFCLFKRAYKDPK